MLTLDVFELQWHEEFLFYLPSSNEIVTLHLVDYNRIMKNVSLGKTVVEIARVTPGVGVDMWLPLDTQGMFACLLLT